MGIGSKIESAANVDAEKKVGPTKSVNFSTQKPKYSFDDIVLHETTMSEIRRVLAHRQHNDLVFNQWGLKNTHKYCSRVCINFYGPSGTGKTMAAHAVAAFLEQDLLIVNYAEIESKYVGETPKNLVAAFKAADESNSILFFDEADALLSKRVTNMSNSTDTSVNQTRSVLLNILNDYQKPVLFATNFIENFDPAFMRRILAHVNFRLPDADTRIKIFAKYIPKEMPNSINVYELVNVSDGLSGSDISNSVLMAAFSAAERLCPSVEMTDMLNAIKMIKESKNANNRKVTIETREVSKEHVESTLGVTL